MTVLSREYCTSVLKYRRLRGDMIEVFKIVNNYYDSEAAVKLNFNTFNKTRGNMYKLQKFMCHYNIRKYSFCARVVKATSQLVTRSCRHTVKSSPVN